MFLPVMKTFKLLLFSLPLVASFPAYGDQVVLGGNDFSDPLQAILHGKQNMEKWVHDGKEFIKQDNLMCEQLRSP